MKTGDPLKKKSRRRGIKTLKDRLHFLTNKINEAGEHPSSYHLAEASALEWALPILEQQVAIMAFQEDKKRKEDEIRALLPREDVPTSGVQASVHGSVDASAGRLDREVQGADVHHSSRPRDMSRLPGDLDS